MKKLGHRFIVAILCLAWQPVLSQTLPYELSIEVAEDVESPVDSYLEAAVARYAVNAGMRASAGVQPSALFRSAVELQTISSDIVRTPVTSVVVEVQVVSNTTQVQTGRSHGSAVVLAKGTGKTEAEARLSAVRNSATLSSELEAHFRLVADDIASYFEGACEGIIRQVNREIDLGNHRKAAFVLGQIPEGASHCWSSAQLVFDNLVESQIVLQCSQYLLQAKAQWAASKSRSSALEVANRLVAFYPGAKCDEQVDALLHEVAKTIASFDAIAANRIEENRAFAKAQYYDALADRRSASASEYKLSRERIDALKEVGIEMARSWAKADVSWINLFGF
jgi:hypothetical protein